MEQPDIADRVRLGECKSISDFVQLNGDVEFFQSFLMSQSEVDGFAGLFSPGCDVEDGRFDGFLSLSFGFTEQVSGVGFAPGSFGSASIDVHGFLCKNEIWAHYIINTNPRKCHQPAILVGAFLRQKIITTP